MGLEGAHLALVHAGEEVPVAIVLAGVGGAEPVVLVHQLARLGRARRAGQPAARMVARPLAGLEGRDVVLALVLALWLGRSNADVDELWPVLKRAAHAPKYAV